MTGNRYDAVIIGGGVVGAAIAREISRYELSVCLVEKCEDVCSEHPRLTAQLFTPDLTPYPEQKKPNLT